MTPPPLLYCLFLTLGLAIACTPQTAEQNEGSKRVQFNGLAQSTTYSIIYYDSLNRNFQVEIETLFKNFNLTASLWDTSSIINQINNNESDQADSLFIDIFNKSVEVANLTDGAFDFTIGPLVALYGFGNKEAQNRIITNKDIEELLPCIGYHKVRVEKGKIIKENPCIQLDFNAIAKGYSVDLIASFLREKGIENYLIEVGGEISAKGKKDSSEPWIIGIEKPSKEIDDQAIIYKKIEFTNKSLATSGNYRKFYKVEDVKYVHTIDPRTGKSIQSNLLSATIIADACWEADGIATACMVMGLEKAKEFILNHPSYQALFIYIDENENLQTWTCKEFEKILVN